VSRGESVHETMMLHLPPDDISRAARPTRDRLAASRGEARMDVPTQVLIATDAQATIENPNELAQQFTSRRVRLHLLIGRRFN